MSYMVRTYRSADGPLICGWWAEHGHEEPLPVHLLPQDGFVVEEDGEPLGVLFVYLTVGSAVAFIEWGITRPGLALQVMRPVLDLLVIAAKERALGAGAAAVWANTLPGIARLLRKHGFRYQGRRATMGYMKSGEVAG